ncbi:glycosyltransferase family 4 protein [Paenibacillus sp. 1P07SE]|uniref:glycosyltransferase family 4 protein n=1 Tax=Paenibacillus sp. 1P07SE TaxID=3132209 RepID=UPI0039A50F3B
MMALREHGIQTEVAFIEPGAGEYIFKDLPYGFIGTKEEFQQKIRTGDYDYLSFIYSLDYLPYVPGSYKGKIVYELRGWNNKLAKNIKNISSYGRVDGIVCIARYLKKKVSEHLKQRIPIFVDGNTVHPMFQFLPPSERTWRECPRPRKGYKVVAFVGRVEPSKNWKQFLEICAMLKRTERIEPWVICNRKSASELPRLVKTCARAGLKEDTRIISEVPNDRMPEIYSVIRSSGGCILSTSMREGLGNHILEPLACGLPVVSSDVPGKNEIITHRHNGMLYPLDEPGKAVRYVKEILNHRGLRRIVQRQGVKTIRRQYAKKTYVQRYLKILSAL